MSKHFTQYRVVSESRPDLLVGLPSGIAMGSPPWFTANQLLSRTAQDMHFYLNNKGMKERGEERFTERFNLEGRSGDNWWIIKHIVPLHGSDPDEESIDDDD